jgi:ATP adenylyltransferase
VSDHTLWAPWRSVYIRGSRADRCFLCDAATEENDRSQLRIALLSNAVAILNAFPYSPGHVLIAPKRHVGDFEQIDEVESTQILRLLHVVLAAQKELMSPAGFNIGLNLGAVAGAGLAEHLHVHLVPRWSGDTNFMPVTAQTRVISQALEETAQALRPLVAAHLEQSAG